MFVALNLMNFSETYSTLINIEHLYLLLVINVQALMGHYIPQISDFINLQLNVVSKVELTITLYV